MDQKKEATSLEGLGVLVVLALVAGGLYSVEWGFLKDEIADYPLYCSGEVKEGQCTGHWYQGTPTVYIINKDQQFVISQQEGTPPNRLGGCAIVDRTNWKCNGNQAGTYLIGYTNGKFWSQWTNLLGLLPTDESSVRRVSRFEWLTAGKNPNQK